MGRAAGEDWVWNISNGSNASYFGYLSGNCATVNFEADSGLIENILAIDMHNLNQVRNSVLDVRFWRCIEEQAFRRHWGGEERSRNRLQAVRTIQIFTRFAPGDLN